MGRGSARGRWQGWVSAGGPELLVAASPVQLWSPFTPPHAMTTGGDSVGAFTKRSSSASRAQRWRSIGMVTLAMVLVASGCSGGASSGAGAAPTAAGRSVNLKGVCPDPVVVQTPWVPQAEHGALYEL